MSHWRIDTISPADGLAFASLVDDRVKYNDLLPVYDDVRDGRGQTVFICAPEFHVQPVALGATADAAEARDFVPKLIVKTGGGNFAEAEFGSIKEVVEVVRRLYNGSSCYFGPEPPTAEGVALAPPAGPPLAGGGATFENAKEMVLAIGELHAGHEAEHAELRFRVGYVVEKCLDDLSFEIAAILALCGADTIRRGLERSQEDEGIALLDAGMQALGAALALGGNDYAEPVMKEVFEAYGDVVKRLGLDKPPQEWPAYALASRQTMGAILERVSAPPGVLGKTLPLRSLKQCLTLALSDAILLREVSGAAWRLLFGAAWLLASHATRMDIPSTAVLDLWRGRAKRTAARWFAQEFPMLSLPAGVEEVIHEALVAPLKLPHGAPRGGGNEQARHKAQADEGHAMEQRQSYSAGAS